MNPKHYTDCLILEDDPARYPYLINMMFAICYPLITRLIICTTAEKANQELLRIKEFNVIMLDHDLDSIAGGINSGLTVANTIKSNNIKFELCIIHSLNYFGASKMKQILDSCGKTIFRPCLNLEIGADSLNEFLIRQK